MGFQAEIAIEHFAQDLCKKLKAQIDQQASPEAVSALKVFGISIVGSSCGLTESAVDAQYPEWARSYLQLFRE